MRGARAPDAVLAVFLALVVAAAFGVVYWSLNGACLESANPDSALSTACDQRSAAWPLLLIPSLVVVGVGVLASTRTLYQVVGGFLALAFCLLAGMGLWLG